MLIADIIAKIESSNNPYAVRYEPLHRPQNMYVQQMMRQCRCNKATAIVLCSTSWGLYQIMGDNLLWLGFNKSPMEFCNNEKEQETYFFDFLERHGIDYSLAQLHDKSLRDHFAAVYNGPGNIDVYSQKILDVIQSAT